MADIQKEQEESIPQLKAALENFGKVTQDQIENIRVQNNRLKQQFERIAINSSLPELMSILIRLTTLFDISLTENVRRAMT